MSIHMARKLRNIVWMFSKYSSRKMYRIPIFSQTLWPSRRRFPHYITMLSETGLCGILARVNEVQNAVG